MFVKLLQICVSPIFSFMTAVQMYMYISYRADMADPGASARD